MLGSQVVIDAPAGVTAIGTDLAEGEFVVAPGVDLTDAAAVDRLWEEHGPFGGVIHGAAYTAVDAAEEHDVGEAHQRSDDDGVVDLVDVILLE